MTDESPPTRGRGETDLAVLKRWEDSGGTWQIASRTASSVTLDLMTCSTGEVMGRLHTSDPTVLAHVAGSQRSD